jgi:hypothetical protein
LYGTSPLFTSTIQPAEGSATRMSSFYQNLPQSNQFDNSFTSPIHFSQAQNHLVGGMQAFDTPGAYMQPGLITNNGMMMQADLQNWPTQFSAALTLQSFQNSCGIQTAPTSPDLTTKPLAIEYSPLDTTANPIGIYGLGVGQGANLTFEGRLTQSPSSIESHGPSSPTYWAEQRRASTSPSNVTNDLPSACVPNYDGTYDDSFFANLLLEATASDVSGFSFE